MEDLRVSVGSGNPVKRRAVEAVLPEAAVDAVAVDSGVSEQPVGHDETLAGAEARARRAFASGESVANDDDEEAAGARNDYDYGVGIEGGVAEFPGADGLYLVMWAAVFDGESVGRGAGPSLELPANIAARIRDGEELGPVMDDVLGTNEIAKKEGAAGALTGGRIDREGALSSAVAGALGPFVTELY